MLTTHFNQTIINNASQKGFITLINSIYQHPTMARYFGVVHDFGDSDGRKIKSFFKEYFTNNS